MQPAKSNIYNVIYLISIFDNYLKKFQKKYKKKKYNNLLRWYKIYIMSIPSIWVPANILSKAEGLINAGNVLFDNNDS